MTTIPNLNPIPAVTGDDYLITHDTTTNRSGKVSAASLKLYTNSGINAGDITYSFTNVENQLDKSTRIVPNFTTLSSTGGSIGDKVYLLGHTVPGLGGGYFIAKDSTGLTADGGTVVIFGALAWIREDTSTLSAHHFGFVPGTTTNATPILQALFNAAVIKKASAVYLPSGNYPIKCALNDNDFTCAIVVRDLINCSIYGEGGTVLKLTSGGTGASEFGFIRFEQCTNLDIYHIEFDGSGIPAQGLGANRSRGLVICNHDVNNLIVDYSPNQRIEIRHNYFHDMGGGIITALRSEISNLPTFTDGVSIHDNLFKNIIGQDHAIAMIYTKNIEVYNNRAINNIPSVSPIDNMFIDVSAGCENAEVRNNYVYGFTFGMKAESHVNVGIGHDEVRTSKRVVIKNNYLDQIGLPDSWDWPGLGGSETFGIRCNGQDIVIEGNTIKPRTIGVTSGGLSIGILLFNSHGKETLCKVTGNTIYNTRYGVLGNHSTDSSKFVGVVENNLFLDNLFYGVLVQARTTVRNNDIFRSGKSAVSTQTPNYTRVVDNRAFDCASTNNDVIPNKVVYYQQGTSGIGHQEWNNNQIIDSRGASGAHYGYFLAGGTTYTNSIILSPGFTSGLLTGMIYDQYLSAIGSTVVTTSTINTTPRIIYSSGIPSSTAPWSSIAWRVGDRAIASVPTVGSPKGWVCTVAGTPGTWVSEGNL